MNTLPDKELPFERIILIGSGKGGVGKSTVALNLAIALGECKESVALLDADLYGPSIPLLAGLRNLSPQTEGAYVLPIKKFGIEILSPGFFIEESTPALWRGPMLHKMLHKLIAQCCWSARTLIIDLPPGTGDVPISLKHLMPITGAVVVTTPQEVALLDARKAMSAFTLLEIPLLGVIENQCATTPLSLPQETPLLGRIPFSAQLRDEADRGIPTPSPFRTIAQKVLQRVR